jgi:hypothetical protein
MPAETCLLEEEKLGFTPHYSKECLNLPAD